MAATSVEPDGWSAGFEDKVRPIWKDTGLVKLLKLDQGIWLVFQVFWRNGEGELELYGWLFSC